MIIRPLAKLLSVFCNAKAITKPAAPITATSGVTLISSADRPSSRPTMMVTRRIVFTTNLLSICDAPWARLMALRASRPSTRLNSQKPATMARNLPTLFAMRWPPSGETSQDAAVERSAWKSLVSTSTAFTESMYRR